MNLWAGIVPSYPKFTGCVKWCRAKEASLFPFVLIKIAWIVTVFPTKYMPFVWVHLPSNCMKSVLLILGCACL